MNHRNNNPLSPTPVKDGGAPPSMVDQIRASTEYVSWFPIKPAVRPCDKPGGCNASNCLGCGESPPVNDGGDTAAVMGGPVGAPVPLPAGVALPAATFKQGNWSHPDGDGSRIVGWRIPAADVDRMGVDAYRLPQEVIDALTKLAAADGVPASDAIEAAFQRGKRHGYSEGFLAGQADAAGVKGGDTAATDGRKEGDRG